MRKDRWGRFHLVFFVQSIRRRRRRRRRRNNRSTIIDIPDISCKERIDDDDDDKLKHC
jgi:hypothetical protein